MKSKDVRETFINFFKKKGHTFVTASPISPDNDPTLLFTNAGMNQFKDVFLGEGTRAYTRAVNSQVCVRVSGKHNDLEDVGRDTTHLTSFEMLGNWSFGDYYKKEAIIWAWELLTERLKINKETLFITVFKDDQEAYELWQSETDVDPTHIVKCGAKDNFWEMGETGPCGPCSEIHVDLHPDLQKTTPNSSLTEVDLDSDRFTELWNLVFIQYDRQKDGDLKPLPKKHVDTGAGLERIVAYLQGTNSNYQTDLFQPIIQKIIQLTGVSYEDSLKGMPHRVLADHIRTLTFGIADNILPSNEGRGYVLRRLLRRALRYAKKLGYNKPILNQLVATVVETCGDHFTHLETRKDFIKKVVLAEEESFLKTLESGLLLFEELVATLQKDNKKTIAGDDAFKLYDTFGFPIDLTQVLAEEKGLSIDMNRFSVCLEKQKSQSRESTKAKQSTQTKQKAKKMDMSIFEGLPLHLSEYTDAARGGEARLIYTSSEKLDMARHHTATHLLHEALSQVLGSHVQQAGSLVDTHRLRFDFTHFESISAQQLSEVERICNQKIQEKMPITITFTTLEKAKEKGVRALFGEKYEADRVRVVGISTFSTELCGGTHVNNTGVVESLKIIQETAIAAGTRRIEALAGTRNIEQHAQTKKQEKLTLLQSKVTKLKKIGEDYKQLGESPKEITQFDHLENDSLETLNQKEALLITTLKKCEKELQKIKNDASMSEASALLFDSKPLLKTKGIFIKKQLKGYDLQMLHSLSDNLVTNKTNALVVLASEMNGKGFFVVKVGAELDTSLFNAGTIIKNLTKVAGGGGGGKDNKAQAGGATPSKLQDALSSIDTQFND